MHFPRGQPSTCAPVFGAKPLFFYVYSLPISWVFKLCSPLNSMCYSGRVAIGERYMRLAPAHQPAIDHRRAVLNHRAIDRGVSDERLVWAFNGILSTINWRISLHSSNGRFLCTMFKLVQKILPYAPQPRTSE